MYYSRNHQCHCSERALCFFNKSPCSKTHSSVPSKLKCGEQTRCPKQMSAVIYFLLLIEAHIYRGMAEISVWSVVLVVEVERQLDLPALL